MACPWGKKFMKPSWLPNSIDVDGVWERVLETLYSIFELDFIQSSPKFEARQIIWDERKIDGRYEEGFWHLITKKDQSTGERYPDFPRAARLPWCAPTINNFHDPVVRVWDYLEGSNRIRTYLWLQNWDYVVILEKREQRRGPVAFLVTAYYVEGDSTRKKLLKKWNYRQI